MSWGGDGRVGGRTKGRQFFASSTPLSLTPISPPVFSFWESKSPPPPAPPYTRQWLCTHLSGGSGLNLFSPKRRIPPTIPSHRNDPLLFPFSFLFSFHLPPPPP
eukprot:Hpha_TRINITY_DN16868_c2_g1::TRINITY_DN16868_c2_g1_i1::g.152729::m.152729